jgi:D-sedoheptulose 7-phosphate isomerase
MLNLENFESKFDTTINSSSWKELLSDFNASQNIFIFGNGGNYAIASHAAADCSRLLSKNVQSFDNMTYMTSCANDFGYDNVFSRYLGLLEAKNALNDCMVIGLTCSGNSPNVCDALEWANSRGMKTAMITGQKSTKLSSDINEVVLDVEHFHTGEILTLTLFYEIIEAAGGKCPTIKSEIIRKSLG